MSNKIIKIKSYDVYAFQSFIAHSYMGGHYGVAIINPSAHNNLNNFKGISIGYFSYKVFARAGDGSIFLVPNQSENGGIAIQFISSRSGSAEATEIDASEFIESDYSQITLQSLG